MPIHSNVVNRMPTTSAAYALWVHLVSQVRVIKSLFNMIREQNSCKLIMEFTIGIAFFKGGNLTRFGPRLLTSTECDRAEARILSIY